MVCPDFPIHIPLRFLFSAMNYRFSPLYCCFFALFCLATPTGLSAQDVRLDSLPNPDSLSAAALSEQAALLASQAHAFAQVFSARIDQAVQERPIREDQLKLAKQDTTITKDSIAALEKALKQFLARKKMAHKHMKQASDAVDFADKVTGMDSLDQRKNLRKLWKQLSELDALLHPPVEKPIAEILKTPPPAETTPDSAATAEKRKAKEKEKKPEKVGPRHKPYDPATDVLVSPPKRPCTLVANTRDEFSGETYRETGREEMFRFTNEVMKKILPPDQPHIVCEAALSNSGANTTLYLTFTIRDQGARKAFGSLAKGSAVTLKFIDGDMFTLNNARNDDGVRDESGQFFTYRGQYAIDAVALKKLRKTELDKLRIAWSTGYEDYEVQGVDVLMRESRCLGE